MSKLTGEEYVRSEQKRALDIVGSTLALGILGVPIGALAVASAIDTRANPFMRQERSGRDGQVFNIFKIRTMREPQAKKPNIIRSYSSFGRIVRKLGLDEAPQLLNVLRGDMSLVGLRPILEKDMEIRERLDAKLFADWRYWHRLARPGLTGPAQIYLHKFARPSPENFIEGMRRDIAYMQHATLLGDMALLKSTILSPVTSSDRNTVIDLTEMAEQALTVISIESKTPVIEAKVPMPANPV